MTRRPALPLIAAGLLACSGVLAQPSRVAQLAVQGDASDNRALSLNLSLPVGAQSWAELGAGRTRSSASAVSAGGGVSILRVGGGWQAGAWSGTLSLSRRHDGPRQRQTDARVGLDWLGERWDAGVDLQQRNARLSTSTGSERLRGPGWGLRAGVRIGEARLYAGWAKNHYRRQRQQAGEASGGLLGTPLGARPTLLTRDEAALSRSALLGASWTFSRASVALEQLQDRVVGQAGVLRSTQLKADVALVEGWSLQPSLGRTQDAQAGGVSFAGLALTHRW